MSKLVFQDGFEAEVAALYHDEVLGRAEAIADACNADSTWGGYLSADSTHSDRWPHATVWSADGRNDEGRDARTLRHLDAGSYAAD